MSASIIHPELAQSPRWVQRIDATSSHYVLLAAAWMAFVAYGSLVPFDFKAPWPPDTGAFSLALYWLYLAINSPKWWDHATIDLMNNLGESSIWGDYAMNLMLYLPIGALLRLRLLRMGRPTWRQIAEPALAVLLLCWAVECMQGMVASRLASYNDIVVNTAGGLIGAMASRRGAMAMRQAVFFLYCRVAHWMHDIGAFVERQREKPVMLVVVTVLNVALFALWWKLRLMPGKAAGKRPVNWLPFHDQFSYPYEVAVEHLGRMMILYMLMGMLLSLQFLSFRRRSGVGVMVLVVAVLAAFHEVLGMFRAGQRADVTQPIVATMTVVGMAYLGYMLVRSVHSCCRRREEVPVAVERRRRPHSYTGETQGNAPSPIQP